MKKSYKLKKFLKATIALLISVFMFVELNTPTIIYALNNGIIEDIKLEDNSEWSLMPNNADNQTEKFEKCIGEKCSHVYRDGNDELRPICEKGVEIINNHKKEIKRAAVGTKKSYEQEAIHLVKVDTIANNLENVGLGKSKIKYVDANFLLDNNSATEDGKKTFRMFKTGGDEEPIFSTVVPKDYNGIRYNRVYFTIYFDEKGVIKSSNSFITDFTGEHPNGKIDEITYKDKNAGEYDYKNRYQSNIELTRKTRNCLYVARDVRRTHWSGYPSMEEESLRNRILYVDNRSSETDTTPFWNLPIGETDLYISYRVKNIDGTYSIVRDKIDSHTGIDHVRYYKFPTDTKATERSVMLVSDKMPEANGQFKDPNTKTYMFLYNVASEDDCLILRNTEKPKDAGKIDYGLKRNFKKYNVEGERYIYLRDRMNEYIGSNEYVQYIVGKTKEDVDKSDKWENMQKVTGSANTIDNKTLWSTNVKINKSDKFIKFRIKFRIFGYVKYVVNTTEINSRYATPTFFLDVLQKPEPHGFYGTYKTEDYWDSKNQKDSKKPKYGNILTGCWVRRLDNSDHGDYSQNIPEGKEEYDHKQYLAKATFYDYYNDVELKGESVYKLYDNNNKNVKVTQQGGIFNYAVDRYYRAKGSSIKNDKRFNAMYESSGLNQRIDLHYIAGDKYGEEYEYFEQGRRPKSEGNTYNNQNINYWYPGLHYATGIVDDTLNKDGDMTQGGKDFIPQFNEGFLRGDNAINTNIGAVYPNVDFGFRLNDEGYWEFDSSKSIDSSSKLKQDKNKGYYLERVKKNGAYVPNIYGGEKGFFPFDDEQHSDKNQKDHLFGMKMQIPFRITDTGVIKKQNHDEKDVIFKFTGDDDLWLFIDDKLALDLGGIHDAITGEINFRTGEVEIRLPIKNASEGPDIQKNIYTEVLKEKLESKYPIANKVNEIQNSNNTPENKKLLIKKVYQEYGRKYLSESEHKLNIFYMERGLAKSNLKITFNFPTKNLLSVENEIDTTAANEFFRPALNTLGGINYFIKNQVTVGEPLAVENSAGFIGAGRNEIFEEINQDSINKITPKPNINTVLDDEIKTNLMTTTSIGARKGVLECIPAKNMPDKADKQTLKKYLVSIKNPAPMDISNFAYLKFDIYNKNATSSTGSGLYVQLTDVNNNSIGDWASNLTYRSYSNVLPQGKWASERISIDTLKKLAGSNVDFTKIQSIEIGYNRNSAPIYLDNFKLFEPMRVNEEIGFSVQDRDISDYGSLSGYQGDYNNAKMSNVDKAWYMIYTRNNSNQTYNEGTPFAVENSVFGLADNQKAEFINKFRLGSYIQLSQENLNPKIFDTSWSLLEEGKKIESNSLVPNISLKTVRNSGTISNLLNVENPKYDVNDGRTVLKEGNEIKVNNDPGKTTFVFRRFDFPDDRGRKGVNLNVQYKNTLKVGGIYLEKEIQNKSNFNQRFTFHIHYRNIAGRHLEENINLSSSDSKTDLVQIVDVVVPKEKTKAAILLDGIPAGTEYTIHEINHIPESVNVGSCYQYLKDTNGKVIEPSESNIQSNKISIENDAEKVHDNVKPIDVEYISKNENNTETKIKYKSVKGDAVYNSIQHISFKNKGYVSPNGAIRITKNLQGTTYTEDRDFLFHVHYYKNVQDNGTGQPLKQLFTEEVVVTVPAGEKMGSTSIQDIPVEKDKDGNIKSATRYWIHEVDDTNLVGIENGKDYIIGTLKENMEDKNYQIDQNNNPELLKDIHTDIVIKNNDSGSQNICGKKITSYAEGTANTSQKEYIFKNSGPVSVAIKKKNQKNEPLADAEFSIYLKENGKEIFIKSVWTTYFEKIAIPENDPNFDKENNRYKINSKSHIVYKENNKKHYYRELTKKEVEEYKNNGTLGAGREVEALAVFDNLKQGTYRIDETVVPVGYVKADMSGVENIKLPFENKNDLMYEIVNHNEYKTLPETGKGRIIKWTSFGMVLVAIGAGFILLKKNKEREGDN